MVKIDFAKYFSRHKGHGNGLIIKGGVRKGKTTLISLIVKDLIDRTDFILISNVRFDNIVYENYPNRIFYINSLRDYLKVISTKSYKFPFLLVWDDAQAKNDMTSKGVMSKGGKALSSFLIFIGKLQTSYIYVAHQSYIPRSLIEGFEPLFLYKINRESFIVSPDFYSYDSEVFKDKNNLIVKMPKYPDDNKYLPILSTAFTDFKFNVDLDKLYEALTEYEIGENTKEGIRNFLNNSNEENNQYNKLKSLTYLEIITALNIKKGRLISSGETIRELFNPKTLTECRDLLKPIGLIKIDKKNLKGE